MRKLVNEVRFGASVGTTRVLVHIPVGALPAVAIGVPVMFQGLSDTAKYA